MKKRQQANAVLRELMTAFGVRPKTIAQALKRNEWDFEKTLREGVRLPCGKIRKSDAENGKWTRANAVQTSRQPMPPQPSSEGLDLLDGPSRHSS